MNAPAILSPVAILVASLRTLARHGWAANSADNGAMMSSLTVAQLCELADTFHALDGVSHSTMRKMGKRKLIIRILADIAG